MKKQRLCVYVLAVVTAACVLFGCGGAPTTETSSSEATASEAASPETAASESAAPQKTGSAYVASWQPREGYTLKKVVAMSRHNLRAPQNKDMETLAKSTTNTWVSWSSNGSELTVKGGIAETAMGEFFRKWLERESLVPENYRPEGDAVRFYANARQRTLATAQFFSSGMLPVANVDIEFHGEYDSRDPVFLPRFAYASDSFVAAATDQISKLGGDAGLAGLDADLQENYDLISEVLDYKNSEAYKGGEATDLVTGDAGYTVEADEEPAVSGSLKKANALSDALTLQYYEADTLADASFGNELSYDQWKQIAAVKNAYGDRRYDSALVSLSCSHLLVQEIANELANESRVFSFLCGHDSNQTALLHALGVSAYELPDTLETKTPIGGKILFEVWENASGESFCNIRYVYATTEQVRNLDVLSLEEPPASFDLDFEGLERNSDGLFALSDVQGLLTRTIDAFDQLPSEYPQEEELAQAA